MTSLHADLAVHDGRSDAVSLASALSRVAGDLVVLRFAGHDGAVAMSADDAELQHRVANLPASGIMTLAFLDGSVSGRDLALALRCALVAVAPGTSLSSGFRAPGAAGVYAAAAARIGARACETLLFGERPLDAESAVENGLASFAAADVGAAVSQARARLLTMLCVAKANLITWPFSDVAARALADR